MGRDQIKGNDSAVFGIDFIAAIVLVMMAVIIAILVMPTLSHEDRDWRIKQYMTATRAADILVQDAESPIGFVYVDANDGTVYPKVLEMNKVNNFPGIVVHTDTGTGLQWWEFPDVSRPWTNQTNVTRVLGLDGYNFYMQLSPVALNGSNFNYTRLDIASINRSKLPINYETASMVDRYVYIHGSCGEGFLCYNGSTVHYRLNLWVW
jgi:hypothetical protein